MLDSKKCTWSNTKLACVYCKVSFKAKVMIKKSFIFHTFAAF